MSIIPSSTGLGLVAPEPVNTPTPQLDVTPLQQLKRVGDATTDLIRDVRDNRAELEGTRAISAATNELNIFLGELENDKDYGTQVERYQERVQSVVESYSGQIQSDTARQRFETEFGQVALDQGIKLQSSSLTKDLEEQAGMVRLNLEQISSQSGNTVDPEARDKIRRTGYSEIKRAHERGILDDLEAAEAIADFMEDNAKADVRRDIRMNPANALKNLLDGKYQGLSAEDGQLWQERAVRAQEAEDRAALAKQARLEKTVEDATKKHADALSREGDLLLREGNLTEDWIEQNIEILSEEDRRYFYRSLDAGANSGKGDPEIYSDLRLRAVTEDVSQEARLQLQNGLITESQFDKLVSKSEANSIAGSIPNSVVRGERLIKNALEPPANFTDPLKRIRQAEAVDTFYEWVQNNPDAPEDQIEARADKIITEFSAAQTRNILREMRRKTNMPAPADKPELQEQQIEIARQLDAGEINAEQAAAAAALLQQAEQAFNNDAIQ